MFRKDDQWSRRAFAVSADDYPEVDKFIRYFNSADISYHKTTLGGSSVINPLPQFTRYADPPVRSMFTKDRDGMGATYAESIHDHQQQLHLRFGVPKFNSMISFFSGFYNYRAGVIARTGRVPETFYFLGQAATVFVFPLFTLAVAGVSLMGYAARFFMDKPSSKYYYLKPTMPTYWSVATIILNYFIINMGMMGAPGNDSDIKLKDPSNRGLNESERLALHESYPDLFSEDGYVDLFAVATKAQRLGRRMEKNMMRAMADDMPSDERSYFGRSIGAMAAYLLGPTGVSDSTTIQPSLGRYISLWMKTSQGKVQPNAASEVDERVIKVSKDASGRPTGSASDGTNVAELDTDKNDPKDGLFDFFQAELDDGGAFASFRVDYSGPQSATWSNNSTESEMKGSINSISSAARNTFFKYSGGNVADIPVIGSLLGGVRDAAMDVLGGAADMSGLSGLMALGGSAFVDIPKHWQDSSFSGPRMSYKFTLDAIYNNPVSRLINQYIPLAMAIAGVIPLGTGKQSYTSPFLCEAYDRGRAVCRLGQMKNMTVTTGNGNLGFMDDGVALNFEVSFDIEDFSTVMAAPLNAFYSTNIISSTFDDDTNFSDYMAMMTGMGLTDMIYPTNKVARNWQRNKLNLRKYSSPAWWGGVFANKTPARLLSVLYKGVDRQ